MHEPEPAGEDDHAFFDDEENADYAKFMLSLDSSGLSTFSKRAKDRVAVPPTSKKKSKQHKPLDEPTSATGETGATPRPSDGTPAPVVNGASPAAATTTIPPTAAVKAGKKKEAVVDAKRRKASTAGWAVVDSGPERLPIKTRHGLLKTNERMQQEEEEEEGPEAAAPGKYSAGGEKTAAAGSGQAGEKKAAVEGGGEEQQDTSSEQEDGDSGGGGGGGDMMSGGDDSVYDSADNSEVEDYTMDEIDDSSAGGVANGSSGRGASRVDLAVLRQRRFEQKKALMGELCEGILGAPEESLVRPKTVVKGEDERSRMEQLSALVSIFCHSCCWCFGVGCLATRALHRDFLSKMWKQWPVKGPEAVFFITG